MEIPVIYYCIYYITIRINIIISRRLKLNLASAFWNDAVYFSVNVKGWRKGALEVSDN